jgi:pimeloyl-ACP methyl ester carboxylesterase
MNIEGQVSSPISRHITRAGGLRWHWREAGDANAPALVLLHASPRHSAMFEPWMALLAPHFRVIAPDTPGYGGSDALPHPPTAMADYVGPLHALLSTVVNSEQGPLLVYGTATGAQLGIAYALQHPTHVRHLCVDNAAHFSDTQCQAMLAHYFPNLTPRADGSHLHTAWQLCTQMLMYFPWYEANEAHRIAASSPDPAVVHTMFSELVAAGPSYHLAYRCAFLHERAQHVQALRVPTTVFRWQASVLKPFIDALLAHAMPAHVKTLDTPAPVADRLATMTAHLVSLP